MTDPPPPPPSPRRSERPRPTIAELGLLIAGIAVAFALFTEAIQSTWDSEGGIGDVGEFVIVLLGTMLGGLSLVGVPLLLWERRRRPRRRWGPGRLQWFATGAAAWLLWPPVVIRRVTDNAGDHIRIAEICYFYGTPLMAVYVTLALLAGRWWRPARSRQRPRKSLPWRERFGLLLGAAWACVGVYVLSIIYRER